MSAYTSNASFNDLPRLVPKQMATDVLSCKVRHLERLCAAGKLVKVVVGKTKGVCVTRDSLVAYIASRTVVAG